jgi:hypothetical protein
MECDFHADSFFPQLLAATKCFIKKVGVYTPLQEVYIKKKIKCNFLFDCDFSRDNN